MFYHNLSKEKMVDLTESKIEILIKNFYRQVYNYYRGDYDGDIDLFVLPIIENKNILIKSISKEENNDYSFDEENNCIIWNDLSTDDFESFKKIIKVKTK